MELTLQRRHSLKCPDRSKGPNFLKCHGHCKLRGVGYDDDHRRIRKSLNTRDLARAARLLAEFGRTGASAEPPRKRIADAIGAFLQHKADKAPETRRKYKRVLMLLGNYCESQNLHFIPELTVETLDGYV